MFFPPFPGYYKFAWILCADFGDGVNKGGLNISEKITCDWIFGNVCCRLRDQFDFPGAGSGQAIRYALTAG